MHEGDQVELHFPREEVILGVLEAPLYRTLKPDQTSMWPGHQFSINHWQNTILHQFMNLLYVLELMSDLI